MKKLLLIICVLVTIALAGVLHGGSRDREQAKIDMCNQEYMNFYPQVMPDMAPYPIVNIPF